MEKGGPIPPSFIDTCLGPETNVKLSTPLDVSKNDFGSKDLNGEERREGAGWKRNRPFSDE